MMSLRAEARPARGNLVPASNRDLTPRATRTAVVPTAKCPRPSPTVNVVAVRGSIAVGTIFQPQTANANIQWIEEKDAEGPRPRGMRFTSASAGPTTVAPIIKRFSHRPDSAQVASSAGAALRRRASHREGEER